jgi:hypothetical protein
MKRPTFFQRSVEDNPATLPRNTGSRRSQSCPTAGVLAGREQTRGADMFCSQQHGGRRSGELFRAKSFA